MESVWNDLRVSVRQLRRAPGLVLAVACTLALGIGVNGCIFSIVYDVVLRELPFREPDRLVALWSVVPDALARLIESKRNLSSLPDVQDWAAANRAFDGLSAHDSGALVTVQSDGEPLRLESMRVCPRFFAVLGVAPARGRSFLPEEHVAGAAPVMMISDRCWRRRFGARSDIVGRTIVVDETPRVVVGVLPAAFTFAAEFAPYRISSDPDVWLPLVPTTALLNRGNHTLFAVARLRSGVTLAQARAEMEAIVAGLASQYPQFHQGWGVDVLPLHESMRGSHRSVLLRVLAAAGMVLVIACFNVAVLLSIRAAGREQEIAVRAALGAGRARVARQLLVESLLLALLGALAGLGLTWLGCLLLDPVVHHLVRGLPPLELGLPVACTTLAVSLVAGALFGLAPVRQASRVDVNDALRRNARSLCAARSRFGNVFVSLEVAVSVLLLVAAGLLLNSFVRAWRAGPGYRPQALLAVNVALSTPSLRDPDEQARKLQRIRERIEALPGVAAVAISSCLPNAVDSQQVFRVSGRALPQASTAGPAPGRNADFQAVSPEYFRALGITLLKGRLFTPQDGTAPAEVVVINETMARRFWPGQQALGAVLEIGAHRPVVVGVVGDVRERGLAREPAPHVYSAYPQMWKGVQEPFQLLVRTIAGPVAVVPAIHQAVRDEAPGRPVRIRTLESVLSESVARTRLVMGLFAAFAVVALLLALVGTGSVVGHAVSRRTREIGIRVAVGARREDVLLMVLARGASPVVLGLAAGMLAALAATRLLSAQLYEITATDPLTYAAVAALMLTASLVACCVPARRALRIGPLVAVRAE